MNSAENTDLDAEELLQLALLDIDAGRHDNAIKKLKRSVALDGQNAKAHYLLGAEHAEIGLLERAIEEMTVAVQLDPALDTAHFQLGLLQYSLGRLEEARIAWQPLEPLGSSNQLFLFKSALLKISDEQLVEAEGLLMDALALPPMSAPLKGDLEKVLGNVRRHIQGADEQAASSVGSITQTRSSGIAKRYDDLAS